MQTKQTTTIEFDNPLLGKGEITSTDTNIVWVGMFLFSGIICLLIYAKYLHKPFVKHLKKRKK